MELLNAGKPLDAIRTFEDGLKAEPQNVLLLNAVGSALMLVNRHSRADHYLRQAIELEPRFVAAHRNLATSLWMQGKAEEARREFEFVLKENASDSTARLFLGLIASKRKDFTGAIRYFERVTPNVLESRPEALLALAGSYFKCNRIDEGTATIQRLGRLPALPAELAFLVGELAVEYGAFEEALALLNTASAQSSDPTVFAYILALVHYKLGHLSQARDLVRDAVEKGRQTGDLYNLLGWISERTGDTQGAVSALRRAIELEPSKEDHYLDLSTICLEHQGTDDLAGQIIDVGLQRIPNSYRLLVQRGIIHEKRGHRADAQQAFLKAMELDPSNGLALLCLGISQWQGNDISRAVASFKEGVERFPGEHRFHYFYALADEKLASVSGMAPSEHERSIAALQRSISLNPTFSDSHFVLGKVYLRLHRTVEAQKEFETALRLNPNHVEAKYRLSGVYRRPGRNQEAERLAGEVTDARRQQLEEESQLRIVLNRK